LIFDDIDVECKGCKCEECDENGGDEKEIEECEEEIVGVIV